MNIELANALKSTNLVDYISRLDLKDGRSYEGTITVYDENCGSVRLIGSEEIRCLDIKVNHIDNLEVLGRRQVEWSL